MEKHIYNRINGLVHMKMEQKLIDAFAELFDDLTADEPFENRDVVEYVAIKLQETANKMNPAGE
jgi:cupin superfamily acireductone dioxygenase involved in methionine salvage